MQSHLIFRRIRELAQEHKRQVIAFVEDAGASGGYMIACAADEIVADPYSIVGSIGVVGGSFGFDKLIAKLGIERRLYTSGEHKAMLDPFLPENPDDVERLKNLQREIHDDFIALVKSRRGGKLNGPESDLFSGEYWTGRRALELGLVDAIGDLRGRAARTIWRQGRYTPGERRTRPPGTPRLGVSRDDMATGRLARLALPRTLFRRLKPAPYGRVMGYEHDPGTGRRFSDRIIAGRQFGDRQCRR